MENEAVSKNFIEQEIDKDLAEGVYDHVCTRFPPEPNGYLHIGHAKSILLNYGLAQKYGGTFHMRFDDTNPTKEKTEFVESIKEDIQWLGADWGEHLYFASDYFDQMYECAVKLIKKGKAYVCDLSADEIREYRIFDAFENDPEGYVYTCNFGTASQLQEYASTVKSYSLYDTGVDVSSATQVVTFSTCTGDGARRIIVQGIYAGSRTDKQTSDN